MTTLLPENFKFVINLTAMRSFKIFKKIAVSILICMSGIAFAYGAGTLQGRVTSTEGEPLPFANIVITHKIEGGQRIELEYLKLVLLQIWMVIMLFHPYQPGNLSFMLSILDMRLRSLK